MFPQNTFLPEAILQRHRCSIRRLAPPQDDCDWFKAHFFSHPGMLCGLARPSLTALWRKIWQCETQSADPLLRHDSSVVSLKSPEHICSRTSTTKDPRETSPSLPFALLRLDSCVAFNGFICIKMGIGQHFDAHYFKCSAAFPGCFAGALKSLDVTHRNKVERGATEMSHGQVDLHGKE